MHRTQINIHDVQPGQTIGKPIVSIGDYEILIPIGDQHFAIIGCDATDSEGYIETSPTNVGFLPHYYAEDDLRTVFDADQVDAFLAEKAARDAEHAENQRKIEYHRYLELKARFEPNTTNP